MPSGTILIDAPELAEGAGAVLYARVSSGDRKADLDRQVARLAMYAAENGMQVAKVVSEVGSGLNGHRKGLLAVLRSAEYSVMVVEHRDRLARFGSEYIEAALAALGRRLIVVDSEEVKDDLVQDMSEVLTSMCARLYGRRSARHRAEKALQAASEA